MVEFDIRNKVLYGADISKGETIISIPEDVESIKHLKITGDVEKLVIPNSVKIIEMDAFEYASNLREIIIQNNPHFIIEKKCLFDKEKKTVFLAERDISGKLIVPSSVCSVSTHAFAHCNRLTQVKLNQKIKYIGSFAFIECFNLEKINIPSLYDFELKEATFEGCSSLIEITIPKNIIALGKCLFYECWNLEKVNIETNRIKTIPIQCFAYCESLIRIDFMDGITEIQDNAFLGCESMTEASFPETVKTIGSSVFLDDNDLTVFSSSKKLATYCKRNKIMFNCTY